MPAQLLHRWRTLPGKLAITGMLLMAASGALSQRMYKCGTTFQDRPCASEDVQQRFSHTSGAFSISQVNPDTDKDCAIAARDVLPYWERMNAGESLDKLRAEVDAKPIGRYQKSRMRDALIAIRQYRGTPKEVRSQLETQCMNYKRANGMPTEKEVVNADLNSRSSAAETRSRLMEERMAAAREQQYRDADERAARIEEMQARSAAAAAARAAAAAARSR